MSSTVVTRLSRTVCLAGAVALITGSVALGSGSSIVRSDSHGHVTAAADVGDHARHPAKLGHKVAAARLPDSAAAARARGEVRATAKGEAGLRPTTPVRTVRHAGTRGVRNTTASKNWAGIVSQGATGTFRGVAGDWYVPQVYVSAESRLGSTWVGVDGSGSSQLIQAGAEEDYINGHAVYDAWWEILPAAETKIYLTNGSLAPVAPGDFMYSYIYQTRPGVYRIFLDDVTQNWYYDQAHYYNGPGVSTEWIQEGSSLNNQISKPTNFRSVGFGYIYVDEGNTWYRTNFGASNRTDIVQGSTRYTTTSVPTQTAPQTFTINYTATS